MGNKEPKTIRFPSDEINEIEQYAEDREIVEADAYRRLLRVGLATEREREPIPDGGHITREKHPWVEPLINFTERAMGTGLLFIAIGTVPIYLMYFAVEFLGAIFTPQTLKIALALTRFSATVGFGLGILSAISIVTLEWLMHETEAPIRQYFPQTWPEEYRNQTPT